MFGMQELAEKIQRKQGIPPDQQHLIFSGMTLSDYPSRTLADLNVMAGDTVLLVLKLCGD